MSSYYEVEWRNHEPEEDIYGKTEYKTHSGTVYAKHEGEACDHYFEKNVNHIISCKKLCSVPRFMTKAGTLKIVRKDK